MFYNYQINFVFLFAKFYAYWCRHAKVSSFLRDSVNN